MGKVAGDSLKVEVPPAEGYGEIHQELMQVVPREAFQGVEQLEPGMAFQAQGQDGSTRQIVVREINGDTTCRLVRSRNSSSPAKGIRRWPPTVRSVGMSPLSHQRFTDDSETLRASATCRVVS